MFYDRETTILCEEYIIWRKCGYEIFMEDIYDGTIQLHGYLGQKGRIIRLGESTVGV